MQVNAQLDPISYFKFEGASFKFDHQKISNRDSVFLCYYLMQNGSLQQPAALIDKMAEDIKNGSLAYLDQVLWLWLLGECVNKDSKSVNLEDFKNIIYTVLSNIESNWQKPAVKWLGGTKEGIYLTNLAMTYGALQSISNMFKNETAQQLMLKIKDFMFKKFLKGGKVLSELGNDEIMGEIYLIAVPFGLLDAGNQILVESVKVIENDLISKGVRICKDDTYYGGCIRNDLTCLLSWYYSERGEIGRAKWLLEQVEAVWRRDGKLYELDLESRKEELYYSYWCEKEDSANLEKPFSYITYAIAKQNIMLKEKQNAGSGTGIQIIHTPVGTGNPYLFDVNERFPRHPEENENVFLRAVTQPFKEDQNIYVIYSVNGGTQQKSKMKVKTSSEGEKFWEADIGSFSCEDKVTYQFEVAESKETIKSGEYNFVVRKWYTLSNLIGMYQSENEISLYFERIKGNQDIPCLRINKLSEHSLKWSFSFEKEISCESKAKKVPISNMKYGDQSLEVDSAKTSFSLMDQISSTILQSYNKTKVGFIDLLTDGSSQVFKIRYNFNMSSDEKIFGLGERYSHVEYRGQDVDIYVYNQYRDQGLRTYIPVPFMLSSKGYGLYLDTALYSRFRFGTRLSDLMEIEVDLSSRTQSLDMYLYTGSPKQIIQDYSNTTGRAVLPPKWAFGPWMSSNNWDSQAEVGKQIELAKKYEIPSTVFVLEQWSDEATFYIFNDAQYEVKDGSSYLEYKDFVFPEWGRWPDPKRMVQELHDEGLKLLLWQAPVMKYMDGIAHAQRDEDERAMLENGYHVKYKNGEAYRVPYFEWFKRSLIPDFTNPETKEWWMNKRKYLLQDIGIDGFKTDGGECIYGEDLLFHDGSTSEEMRNKYPNTYIGTYYDYVAKHTNGNGITFSRAGYTGAQKIPLHWAGDERSTYKAFAASVRAGLSCSLSGIPFWGWDLGGFNGGIPTAELYIRATQMAALCPVMQYHAETKGEFNQDRTPWNIAERTGEENALAIYKKYSDLRMNLLPYIYHQAINTCKTGIPMMRAMHLEYPDDASCTNLWQQYMFGDNLLVAPILEENSTIKDLYLPEGKWMNLFDGKIVSGPTYLRVKADLDEIPVYIRQNSIIPLNLGNKFQLFEHVSNRIDAYRNLSFMFFVTDTANCHYTDDLGSEIDINAQYVDNNISVEIESNYSPITLIFRGISGNTVVSVDGNVITGVSNKESIINNSYAICDSDLIIKTDCKTKKQKINISIA